MQNHRISLIAGFSVVLLLLTVFVFNSVQVYKFRHSEFSVKEILAASLNQEAQVAIKLHHARSRSKPYDIGVFGNSRAFMVSEVEMNLQPGETFFNFSNGGSAFSQSVKIVEELALQRILPKVVLISLDHPQIQYTGYIKYPQPVWHLGSIIEDFFTISFANYGNLRKRLSDAFKVLDWAKGHTWKSVKAAWKPDVFFHRVNYAFGVLTNQENLIPEHATNYRADGSIVQVLPTDPTDFSDQHFGYEGLRGWDRHVFLGIKRLNQVAKDHDVRIVVYESPIWPQLEVSDTHTRKDAVNTHKWFVAGCQNTEIECIDAWKLENVSGEYWPDCCHAPAADLGFYLRNHVLNKQADVRAF